MVKKLSKFGNSMALIIDKPILQLLNINKDTELELKIVDGALWVTPIKTGRHRIISKDKKAQAAYEDLMEKYDEALKKLADS